jgi:hypothetical protein
VVDVGTGGPAAQYLADHLALRAGDAPCAVVGPVGVEPAPKGWAHFRWRVACTASGPRSLASRVLLEVAPSHLHFARVAGDGADVRGATHRAEPVTRRSRRRRTPATGTTLGYVALRCRPHRDRLYHLAFPLAAPARAPPARVAVLVTAFTAAHSVTLGLAVLGLVRPNGAAIEALIGYSIALVAAENVWLLAGGGAAVPAAVALGTASLAAAAMLGFGSIGPLVLGGLAVFASCHFALLARVTRPTRLRAAVAFVFGLVHGFGFAGVLAEMDLPTARLAPALFGFNVGVELGQLAVIAIAYLAVGIWGRNKSWYRPRVVIPASATVAAVGLFWTVQRVLGS